MQGIIKKDRVSLVFFTLTMMMISYSYMPKISNDLARYHLRYLSIQSNTWEIFYLNFYQNQEDIFYYLLIFVFAKLYIPMQVLTALVCGFIVGARFYIANKLFNNQIFSGAKFLLIIILVFFSLNLAPTISGSRYQLALTFLILAFYYSQIENKKVSWLYLLLASITHFGLLAFVPAFALLKTIKKNGFYNIVFIISLLFLLLTPATIGKFVSILPISDIKIAGYLGEKDFLTDGLGQSIAGIMVFTTRIFKLLFLYFYLLKTFNVKSKYRNLIYILIATSNLFFSAYTVYNRYIEIALFFFVILYAYENRFKKLDNLIILLVLYFLESFSQFIRMLPVIIPNYSKMEYFSLIGMLLKKVDINNFIQ